MVDIIRIEQELLKVAYDAGAKILSVYNSKELKIEIKEDNSPLTEADKLSHSAIMNGLSKLPQPFSSYPILSEEGVSEEFDIRKKWERYWLIDPLDGTKEFIKRNGDFTVNIALIENHKPIAGAVYVPTTDIMYWGVQSMGAWKISDRGRIKTSLSNTSNISNKKINAVISRSHLNDATKDFVAKLEKNNFILNQISRGSSIKLCLVAEGLADIYPRFAPTMEWDTAAADAICRAAGCTVWDIENKKEMTYNKKDLLNPYFIVMNDKNILKYV